MLASTLLCCGHGHVSSSSLLQRTASAGRTWWLPENWGYPQWSISGMFHSPSILDTPCRLWKPHETPISSHLCHGPLRLTIPVTGSLVSNGIRRGSDWSQAEPIRRAKPPAAERLPLPPLQWRVRWSPPALTKSQRSDVMMKESSSQRPGKD